MIHVVNNKHESTHMNLPYHTPLPRTTICHHPTIPSALHCPRVLQPTLSVTAPSDSRRWSATPRRRTTSIKLIQILTCAPRHPSDRQWLWQ